MKKIRIVDEKIENKMNLSSADATTTITGVCLRTGMWVPEKNRRHSRQRTTTVAERICVLIACCLLLAPEDST